MVEYDHKVYAKNMESFFKTLSNLTENVSLGEPLFKMSSSEIQFFENLGDISRLFSNRWLDKLFKPEWERWALLLDLLTFFKYKLQFFLQVRCTAAP